MSNKENWEPENGHAIYREKFRPIEGIYYDFDYGSDEDTDDADETALVNDEEEYTEIKEQMYRDKLADLKNQLNLLHKFEHPVYMKAVKKLEEDYDERQFRNDIFFTVEVERINREHKLEKEAAYAELHEKQRELSDNLIADLEEKKRLCEIERSTMDITNDIVDSVPLPPVRKLRRRGNDPPPLTDPKRRKNSPNTQQIKFELTEDEIDEDLRKINEDPTDKSTEVEESIGGPLNEYNSSDIRVENGKLYYEKYWYHRGQQIYYEGKDAGNKISAVISTITPTEVWVKRTIDNEKHQIFISELLKGSITLKRRSA